MKFELDTIRTGYIIRAYERDSVVIGEIRHVDPLVLTPKGIHSDLLPRRFSDLALSHLEAIAALGAEILIIGCGPRQIFLDAGIISEMGKRGIGVEVMSTAAACRCYNVLASEQRAVAAVLFIH